MRLIDADALKRKIEAIGNEASEEMQGRRNEKTLAHGYLIIV